MVHNTLDDNTTFWSVYYSVVENALGGWGIVSGCAISKGTGDWDIDVTSGTVFITGTGEVSVSSGTVTLTDPASDADMDAGESRIDLVTADTGGSLAAVEGTAASNPDAPDIPADEVVLGFVHIENSDSTVADSDIIDVPALLGDDSVRYHDGSAAELDGADLAGDDGTVNQFLQTDGTSASWANPLFTLAFTFFQNHNANTGTSSDSFTEVTQAARIIDAHMDAISSGDFQAIARVQGGTGEIRLRDTTNSATLATVSTTNTSDTRLTDTSISNIPSGQAELHAEFRQTGGAGGDQVLTHMVSVTLVP